MVLRFALALLAVFVAAFSLAGGLGECSGAMAPFAGEVSSAAQEFGVPASLLVAVALVESNGDVNAVRYERDFPLTGDWTGARSAGWTGRDLKSSLGAWQIMGAVAYRDLKVHDPPSALLDPAYEARMAAKFLAQLDSDWGAWGPAIAYYNGGIPAAVAYQDGRPVPYVVRVMTAWSGVVECMAR